MLVGLGNPFNGFLGLRRISCCGREGALLPRNLATPSGKVVYVGPPDRVEIECVGGLGVLDELLVLAGEAVEETAHPGIVDNPVAACQHQ